MGGRIPAEVFPPGEFIREELEARGWTQTDLAEILGRPFRLVNEIISGKRSITPETAVGLGQAFGTGPQFWMNLESSYRLSLVKGEDHDVSRRAKRLAESPRGGSGRGRRPARPDGARDAQLPGLVRAYREQGRPWPATARQLAEFAIERGLWEPPRGDKLARCLRDISRALDDHRRTDAQGRSYRGYHAIRRTGVDGEVGEIQEVLWDDIETASPEFMECSIEQRRAALLQDCLQLRVDVDNYNENSHPERPIGIASGRMPDAEGILRACVVREAEGK
jgi:addiction module HigA family antidote